MKSLERKVPPPVVLLLVGGAMWWVARESPLIEISVTARIVAAGAIAALGIAIAVAGAVALRRAGTTVNPIKPETATAMVTGGVYRFTRNPMYLGLLLLLVAWAVYLSSAWALLGPLLFALYITRFQIVPEERAPRSLFGPAHEAYMSRTRRWL